MADDSTKTLKDTVSADVTAAETAASNMLDKLLGYLPADWKKYVVLALAVLVIWQWGMALVRGVWDLVPERASVVRVLPATQGDVADSNSAAFTATNLALVNASKAADLNRDIAHLNAGLEALSISIDALGKQSLQLETRTTALEAKLSTITGSLGNRRPTKRPAPAAE